MFPVSAHYVDVALRSAERSGLDRGAVLQAAGIDMARLAADGAVTESQFCALWRYLWDALEDEFLGCSARPCRRGSFAMACKLAYAQPSLERVFKELQRVYSVLDTGMSIALLSDGSEVMLVTEQVAPERDIDHFLVEYWLFYCHRLACWLTNRRVLPLRAEFPYPEPSHIQEYQTIFRCPLQFNAQRAALVFSNDFASLRPQRSRRELYAFLNRLPADFMAIPGEDDSLSTRIRLLMLEQCEAGQGIPNASTVAQQLGVSDKTLRRRLQTEGTSFQQLKDGVRQDLVLEQLRDNRLSIQEIALRAGFEEATSLSRAFRQWMGVNPQAYRDSLGNH